MPAAWGAPVLKIIQVTITAAIGVTAIASAIQIMNTYQLAIPVTQTALVTWRKMRFARLWLGRKN
jgi:hypothetical protein